MTRINMHISKAKLLFYPPCEVKCRLQNGVSTSAPFFLLRLPSMWISYARTSCGGLRIGIKKNAYGQLEKNYETQSRRWFGASIPRNSQHGLVCSCTNMVTTPKSDWHPDFLSKKEFAQLLGLL